MRYGVGWAPQPRIRTPLVDCRTHLSCDTVFLVACTLSQALSGKLYDRIGTKRGFAFSIVVWSLASMTHAFARGLNGLLWFRFVLGLGRPEISPAPK